MNDPVIARVVFCGNEFGPADVTVQSKLDPKTVRVSGPTNKAPIGTTIQQIFAPYLRLATIKLS